jgi:multiple sugar transport system permease protein
MSLPFFGHNVVMILKSKIINRGNIGWFYALPALVYMGYFVAYPIVSNIILSMQDVTVMTIARPEKPFIGFKNYSLLFADPVLWRAVFNTLFFTFCCLVFQFIIGFALALFFNRNSSLSKSIRGILMMPWMIPITITALIFRFMFSSNVGIINHALLAAGLIARPIDWLITPSTAMFALITANVWIGIPFNMILISTGLTTIPKELYESASIDGANKVKSFFRITLPLLRPTIESVLILGFIYTFKVFDLVYVMTGGGPVNSTQVLSTFSYKLSFVLFKYSQGAATANILFIILFIAGLFYLKLTYSDKEA